MLLDLQPFSHGRGWGICPAILHGIYKVKLPPQRTDEKDCTYDAERQDELRISK